MNTPARHLIGRLLPACLLVALASVAMAAEPTAEPAAASQEQIARLIEQLGDEDYFERQKAQQALADLGFEAADAVEAATRHENLEIATRAKYLLQSMRVTWIAASDSPKVVALLKNYAREGMPTRLSRIHDLAELPNNEGAAALCRLIRLERSDLLARHAAIGLLAEQLPDEKSARLLREHLRSSSRPPAQWVRAYAGMAKDSQAALAQWAKLVDVEYDVWQNSPERSSRHVLTELIRYQVTWLRQTGQDQQAVAAIRRLLEVQRNTPENLAETLDWLIDQKAWAVVDELADRHAETFAGDPELLYMLAEAVALQGDQPRADQMATKALRLRPGKDASELAEHYRIAHRLHRRDQTRWALAEYRHVVDTGDIGLPMVKASLLALLDGLNRQKAWGEIDALAVRFDATFRADPILLYTHAQALTERGDPARAETLAKRALELAPGDAADLRMGHIQVARTLHTRGLLPWAKREYRHVINTEAETSTAAYVARYSLSEMLHDQGEDLEAAKVRQEFVEAIKKQTGPATLPDKSLASFRARMYYFFSCHHQSQNEPVQRRENLDKAIEADPTDTDSLIACYSLPDQGDAFRRKIGDLVDESIAVFRRQISESSTSPTAYNHFAWLVANTRGDLDEALACSKKSIELSPDSSGYYDTLAHVYFARGEYEKAVEVQTKAARLEPHSGLINKKLADFRKKWEETRKEKE